MARKIKSITSDPRYPDLVKRYRYDWIRFAVEMIGKEPTWQQRKIIESTQKIGSLTSVSSGHGTGKSDLTSIMILAYMLCFPNARVVIVANNARQVQIGVWKYIKMNFNAMCKRKPWLQTYFTLSETAFFENSAKGVWQAGAKSCRIGNEEALAGEHNARYLIVVDEASGVSDKAMGVLTGALTEEDNRCLLLSQPTRPAGYFYDTHHKLAERNGKSHKQGHWTAIRLNSEESPLVTEKFLLQKRLEYGGREATEYLIKVRGEFPTTIAGFLMGRSDADKATRSNPTLAEDWGWVALCDVGNGRDKSILNIMKVSGQRTERVAVTHKLMEQDGSIDPVRFADIIKAECSEDLYPNITIAIDSDGVGYDTATCCERYGLRVQRIRWGKRMHSTSDRQRFYNQRAFAHIMMRDAIRGGRMRIDSNVKTAEQMAKLPCFINESGQWLMMAKKLMKEKLNISSPDRSDTYCFSQIVNYIPAGMTLTSDMEESRRELEDEIYEDLEDL